MPVTDLGSSTTFVNELRRSGLIERGQLESILETILNQSLSPEPQQLAQFLVQQGHLTPFQAERILNGKSQGLILGQYIIIDSIGSGSMGAVYRAISKNDRRHYAVKVLPRRSMWNVRLARRQVRAFGQFSHPTVVPFVDVGTSGGLHYLVWSYVEGQSLESFVKQLGRLDSGTAAQIGQQIAVGLNAAHSHGLVHGLIKPSNIMLDRHSEPRLLDFGIGSLLAENENESLVDTMSTANTLTSGLDCASPESILDPSNRTAAGDQYSLGCTLYFCLTGRYPFPDGTAVEKMMAHQTKEPAPIVEIAPDVPPPLASVIDRLMRKKPEERYFGLDEVAEALAPFAAGSGRSISSSILNFAVPRELRVSQSSVRLADTPARSSESSATLSGLSGQTKTTSSAGSGSGAKLPISATGVPLKGSGSGSKLPSSPPSGPSGGSASPLGNLQVPTRQSLSSVSLSSTILNLGKLPLPHVATENTAAANAPAPGNFLNPSVQPPASTGLSPSDPAAGPGVPTEAPGPFEFVTDTVPRSAASSRSVPDHPLMGPLGFIALGATVALASYLVVLSMLR